MKSPRSAAFLHSAAAALERVAKRLDPPRSMADECEALRKELEAEAAAEFGLRNVEFSPDPASPGDVWPQSNVSHLTAYGRAIRRHK